MFSYKVCSIDMSCNVAQFINIEICVVIGF